MYNDKFNIARRFERTQFLVLQLFPCLWQVLGTTHHVTVLIMVRCVKNPICDLQGVTVKDTVLRELGLSDFTASHPEEDFFFRIRFKSLWKKRQISFRNTRLMKRTLSFVQVKQSQCTFFERIPPKCCSNSLQIREWDEGNADNLKELNLSVAVNIF